MDLTIKQKVLRNMISDFVELNGYCPSINELAEIKGVVPNAILDMLLLMRKKGAVDWVDGQSRTLHVVKNSKLNQGV